MTAKEFALFELRSTDKFVNDYAYVSNLSTQEKFEMEQYRKELVKIVSVVDEVEVKFSFPSRPGWANKYE